MGVLSFLSRKRDPGREPVRIASPQFKADPYPFYARLRAEEPAYRLTMLNREAAWLVTRYDDVAAVLKDAPVAAAPASSPSRPPTAEAKALPALQVLDCYLVVEASPDEVLFIDQHALHERILFEQLRQRFEAGAVEAQRLLVPEPVELPPLQAAQVLEHRAALAELGLTVEAFGGHTVLLHSYPALLNRGAPGAILRAVADYLAGRERPPDRGQLLYGLLSLMACHAAVRAGDRLTAAEIAALVGQRELARDGHHCPHGRPTTLVFHRRDLERLFRRT
jgi:DNA mismatch repair protein MutL